MRMDSLNTTAYRIFRILQWLCETPLSVDELNARFMVDPLIRRKLSEDSIWLYLNTLKLFGCKISRPSSTNAFRYRLDYHPFGLDLTERDITMFRRLKQLAEEQLGLDDILAVDALCKTLIQQSSYPEVETALKQLFSHTRSLDYADSGPHLQTIRQAIANETLLGITYRSPAKGEESFYFLPARLSYQKGVLQLQGMQANRSQQVTLRVDRLTGCQCLTECKQPKAAALSQLQQQLKTMQTMLPQVVIRFYGLTPEQFEPLGMQETLCVLPESNDGPVLEVTLYSADFFSLQQRIFEQGVPFAVMSPTSFKQQMQQALEQMYCLYQPVQQQPQQERKGKRGRKPRLNPEGNAEGISKGNAAYG